MLNYHLPTIAVE